MQRRTVRAAAIAVLVSVGVGPSCKEKSTRSSAPSAKPSAKALTPPARVDVESRAMGTFVSFAAYGNDNVDEPGVRRAIASAMDELRRIEKEMSSWRSDSDVGRLNANAGRPVAVGPDTFAVIEKSLWAGRISFGTFDITFASMGDMWRFRGAGLLPDTMPSAVEVERRRTLVNYRAIDMNDKTREVTVPKGRKIGLEGIAKGYAVDRAVEVLIRHRVTDFLVQVGGDLYASGKKTNNEAWTIGIQDPRGSANESFATLELRDCGFSTSGDYERYYVHEGRRYHHIIDPRTGYPAVASRSVSVMAPSALVSDAVDNAVFILGPARGLPLVEGMAGLGVVIVDADNRVWISERLKGRVKIQRQPTP